MSKISFDACACASFCDALLPAPPAAPPCPSVLARSAAAGAEEAFAAIHEAGAVVLPASPGFYHGAHTVADLVDFVVARICDQVQVPHALVRRWGEAP